MTTHWTIRQTERRAAQVARIGQSTGLGQDFSAVVDYALSYTISNQEATMLYTIDLDIGVWYEDRFGYIFSAHEVETDDGIQYAITTHKGEMPAHNSLTYRTKTGILDAMAEIAPFEDWNPRTE